MLKVLNINKIIKENDILEVTSRISFNKENEPEKEGLYSPIVFGTTSKEISKNFGYIKLNAKILHPAILNSLIKVDTIFKKIIYGTDKVALENGVISLHENGSTGIGWLFNVFDKIDFTKYDNPKKKNLISYFTELSRDEAFIDKYLVIPPKFRMFTEEHGRKIEDELTMLYKALLGLVDIGQADTGLMQHILKNSNKDLEIQKAVLEIYNFFLERLEKKGGQFRSTLVSKRVDNNTRLVANARPDIPFDCVGLPWHVLLNVFDVFVIAYLIHDTEDQYAKKLGVSNFSNDKLGKHFDYIYRNADTYTEANPGKRELWVLLLKDLFELHPELKVLTKRDPAWDKNSYHALYPLIIPTNSYHIIVNSLIYKPMGGDSFSSRALVFEKDNLIIKKNGCSISTNSDKSYYLRSLEYFYND